MLKTLRSTSAYQTAHTVDYNPKWSQDSENLVNSQHPKAKTKNHTGNEPSDSGVAALAVNTQAFPP